MTKRIIVISIAFLFFCLTGSLNAQSKDQTFRLKGQVRDVEANQPLPGVNVFLNQTMQGTSTDKHGTFELANVHPGTYTLVVSMIGYEIIHKKISVPEIAFKKILVGLTPLVLELPDIVVEAERPRNWQKNLERFEDAFLGYTENASQTTITNPEILDFSKKKGKLTATTQHNPLILINESLGYKIEFYLSSVELEDNTLNTYGFTKYEELVPTSVEEYDRWQHQRSKAYVGSFRHFVRTLAAGELEKGGFIAFYSNSQRDQFDRDLIENYLHDSRVRGKINDPSEILAPSTFQNHVTLINPESRYIGVIFTKEPVERKLQRLMNTDINLQVSLIELPGDTALLDVSSGNYRFRYRPVLHGSWGISSRLPDLLPDDFDTPIFAEEDQPITETQGINFSRPDSLLLENSWKKGQQFIESGDYDQALKTWETIYNLYTTGRIQGTDPRIGFRYMEIVTDLKLRSRYKEASELYNWGLKNVSELKYKEALSKEIERLEPIVTNKGQKNWRQLLNENQLKELAQSIKGFWELRDPAPSTPVNERLLEHWERLAFVKDRFTRNHSWVYGTDDRAKIYVKYGEPDNAGDISTQSDTKSTRAVDLQSETNVPTSQPQTTDVTESVLNSSESAESQSQGAGSSSMALRDPDHALDMAISHLTLNPNLRVWIYGNSTYITRDDIIFLFGNDGNTGEFRQLGSIEDVIPTKAFRSDPYFYSTMVPPSLILQQSYYSNLGKYHPIFNQIYFEIQRLIETSNIPGSDLSKMFRSQNKAKFSQLQYQAPVEQSEYASKLYEIPVTAYQFRLLNEWNEPVLATFVESKPHRSLFIDQIKEKTFDSSFYKLVYSARVAGTNSEVIFEDSHKAPIKRGYGSVENMESSVTYFEIPNPVAGLNQVFATELHNQTKSSTELSDYLFPENIRGIGKYTAPQPAPLSKDTSRLEAGDLIVGYKDESTISKSPFAFRIAPEGRIPKGEEIIVHLEVYHLNPPANQSGRFKIDYLLEPKEGILKKIFGADEHEQVRLTLNFETMESSYRDNLEIKTSELEAGEYILSFTFSESRTGQIKSRTIPITIVEL